ncbi:MULTISPECIES: hypothetical protein [Desulfococcus]|jgi:hypothetical protein|uniref:Uncharacterized protein n=1 Tax=Desulfococcus multivorans DSM 2059 TaxID=1121405 RepID=S7TQ50_DESML|nr:hypothetical protein [Desulfococcus multivorans]AOY58997.1 uncharacterized protein Dmul_22250 [Desulfococcus multivorans]AQV01261.1 hypothetical protein B2D07_11110 [Desulfococcus multivorans]EPR39096.1 hypothetical protein dsmv_2752 [Desulfococcus multivorans DSM 2059]SJZ55072.1 hypothetical protein SAMN02745446_00923 [Desulfococcus multivorans DSM 2059]
MIYIGSFLHTTNQQEESEEDRRHGEFNLLVDAASKDAALHLFRDRIRQFRDTTDLFEGECRIFLSRLLELDGISKGKALLTNYKSVAGDPLMPYIGCSYPSEETDGCRIIDWNDNRPEIDGREGHLFLKFEADQKGVCDE